MMCWHKWKITNTEVLPSMLEQISARGGSVDNLKVPRDPSIKPCIVTKRCEKCGTEKVNRI